MITLQQLNYFRALAKTEQLTKTAESLCIAQTTLSTTIGNLEKQLGVQLFDRIGRNIQLSEPGKIYLSYVNEALDALENGEKAVTDFGKKKKATVSVAMTSSYVWQSLIRGFMKAYPDDLINQSECRRDDFRMLLSEQAVDFVISGTRDFSTTGFRHAVIYEDDVYLCVPKNHPLASRKKISLKDAAGETFIDLPQSSSFRYFCDRMFEQAGIRHETRLECDYMIRGQLVESGIGVALMTNLAYWKKMMKNECKYLLLTDDFAKREISIFWNPKKHLPEAAKDFLKYVRGLEGEIIF